MKRFVLCLMVLFASTGILKAQQDAMYTQYMFNTLALNPAYAGSRNVLSATALYRSQWVGVEGAPETQTLSFDSPLRNKKVGLGIQVFNDRIGITKTTGGFASYAYRIIMEKSTLSFGLQAGMSHYRADFTSVDLRGDGSNNDYAFSQNVSKLIPNVGTGVFFNTDKFYIGASVPHLLNNTLINDSVSVSNQLVAKQYLHAFLLTGYVFELDPSLKLRPSFLLKAVGGAPLEADINANLWIKDVLSVGVSYRTKADISFLFELQASNQFRIGYAYDRSLTKLVQFNSGSHEIMLRYEFGFSKNNFDTPRRYF